MKLDYTKYTDFKNRSLKRWRKFFFIFISLSLACSASAASFKAGRHYVMLNKPATSYPEVLDFFSFYCAQCYRFEQILKLKPKIALKLPPGGRFKQYHIAGFGPLGETLTRAWAVAITLGIEHQIKPILFDGIQKNNTVQTEKDIRQAFINTGVSAQVYDNTFNSFAVNTLVYQQQQAVQTANIYAVPALLINGKYQVNLKGFLKYSEKDFVHQYIELVGFLLTKNE